MGACRRTSRSCGPSTSAPPAKFPKDAIKAAAEKAGFTDVETYINTGNVRVTTRMRSRAKVEEALEKAFRGDRGFEVPTIAFTPGRGHGHRRGGRRSSRRTTTACTTCRCSRTSRRDELIERIEAAGRGEESARVGGRAVHLLLGANYHEAKLSNATVEKLMGVATNRNLKVIRTVAEKWGE